MNPKRLLKNEELQTELNDKGFIKVPFIGEEELEQLRSYYHQIHPNGAPEKIDGIHMTTWCGDLDYKLDVKSNLEQIYSKACEDHFIDYRTLNNVFIVKDQGETPFKVHQDWNVVDEVENFAINVWVPLYDVSKNEGALWVIEGSHKIDRNVRGSAYLFPDYSPYFDQLEKAATSVDLKAGEAIIFYVNIIHGSPENHGERERIATCFSVIPKNASLNIFFQKQAGDQLEIHEPSDDFVYQYKHLRTDTLTQAPTQKPIELRESFVNKPVSLAEIQPFLKSKSEKKSFLARLFG